MALVTKSFSDIITFTRASTATYFDSNGVLQTAGNNVPRLDFNPATLAAQGLLIEEARTNSIRNNTMQGAVAGTPGTLPQVSGAASWGVTAIGLTQTIVGIGIENGITYIDIKLSGTTSGQFGNIRFEPNNIVAASSGQTWATSAYLKLIAGSFANLSEVGMVLYAFTSAPAFISSTNTQASVTSSLTRFAHVGTMPVTTAFVQPAFYFNTTLPSGQAVDFTIRIGLPQLELGAFATSVIPTTTTALTRSADVASVNTVSPWYNQTEGTVYAEFQSLSPLNGAQSVALGKYPHVWQIEAGASDSSLWCYGVVSELYISTTFNNIGAVPSGINKIAVSLAPTAGQSRSSLNGAAAVNRNGTLTGTATLFSLGKDSTNNVNNFLNGYLRRLTYYPRALSAAELQAITA